MDPKPLRTCQVTYAALRAAFVTTLDSLLRYSLDPIASYDRPTGFFDCFPMLNSTTPQVQLECLLTTWERWNRGECDPPTLLDDCVFYASYEALARISTERPNHSLKVVLNGPESTLPNTDLWLRSKTRCLQVACGYPVQADFMRELAQIDDGNPWFDKDASGEIDVQREELQDLVGRWAAVRSIVLGSEGLLTSDEQDILRAFFEEHPGLVR